MWERRATPPGGIRRRPNAEPVRNRSTSDRAIALVVVLIAGPVVAFGGVYPWGVALLAIGVAALVMLARPALPSADRVLDLSLLAALTVGALYLVPLPLAAVRLISHRRVVLWDALALGAAPAWLPFSLNPADTLEAVCNFAAAIFTFFCCRSLFAHGGVRRVSGAIAWTGFALACVALIQKVTSPTLIYGFWRPQDVGATPFGPFVNRNHGAGWLVMATAACVGGLMAEAWSSGHRNRRRRSLVDPAIAWPVLAAATMVIAIVWSLSRSAMLATMVVAGALSFSATRRRNAAVARAAAVLTVVAGLSVLLWGDLVGALTRLGDGVGAGLFDRPAIWRDTWTMIADSPLIGTGPGTFRTAMLHYQTADHTYIFNQAHNHALQVLAEGGLLLGVPIACAGVAFVAAAARRLRQDATGLFWIRAGAAAGLAAIAAQSMWETTLCSPAASQLAAVLAAALLCQPVHSASEPLGRDRHQRIAPRTARTRYRAGNGHQLPGA